MHNGPKGFHHTLTYCVSSLIASALTPWRDLSRKTPAIGGGRVGAGKKPLRFIGVVRWPQRMSKSKRTDVPRHRPARKYCKRFDVV